MPRYHLACRTGSRYACSFFARYSITDKATQIGYDGLPGRVYWVHSGLDTRSRARYSTSDGPFFRRLPGDGRIAVL
jgi:hypothetical protein